MHVAIHTMAEVYHVWQNKLAKVQEASSKQLQRQCEVLRSRSDLLQCSSGCLCRSRPLARGMKKDEVEANERSSGEEGRFDAFSERTQIDHRAQAASSCARASTCSVMGKDSNVPFLMDFLLGGVSGPVAKTLTAPIERVKLAVQTQDANPKIRSGEVPRYTGIVDRAQRTLKEQGLSRFRDGNFTNCLRYFPTQAFNLAVKDTLKKMFPKYTPKTEFWQFFGANLVSGGLARAGTRLASDVGSGKATFSGLGDCIVKTSKGPGGFFAPYTGFGVSVYGINRGLQLGTFDTITGLQQMQAEKPVEEHIYKGTTDCFRKIAFEEGLMKVLYKGFVANIVRSVGEALGDEMSPEDLDVRRNVSAAAPMTESSKSFTVPVLSQDVKGTARVGGYLFLHVDDADTFVSLPEVMTAMQQAVGNLAKLGGIVKSSKVDLEIRKRSTPGKLKVSILIEVLEASESAQSIAEKISKQDIETVTGGVRSELNAAGLNFTVRDASLRVTILPAVNDLGPSADSTMQKDLPVKEAVVEVKEHNNSVEARGRTPLRGMYRDESKLAPLLHAPSMDDYDEPGAAASEGKEVAKDSIAEAKAKSEAESKVQSFNLLEADMVEALAAFTKLQALVAAEAAMDTRAVDIPPHAEFDLPDWSRPSQERERPAEDGTSADEMMPIPKTQSLDEDWKRSAQKAFDDPTRTKASCEIPEANTLALVQRVSERQYESFIQILRSKNPTAPEEVIGNMASIFPQFGKMTRTQALRSPKCLGPCFVCSENFWLRKLATGKEVYVATMAEVSQVVFVIEILAQIRGRGIDLDRLARHKAFQDGLTLDKKGAIQHLTKLLVDQMQKWLPVTQADSGSQHQIAALLAEIAELKAKAGSAPLPEAQAPEGSSQPPSHRAPSPVEAALRGNKPVAFDPAQLLVTPGSINQWLQTNMSESFSETKYKAWFKGLKLDITSRQTIERNLVAMDHWWQNQPDEAESTVHRVAVCYGIPPGKIKSGQNENLLKVMTVALTMAS
eukprot:symbB.v1.2.006824.t1/scaffold379.1/size332124/6